jgi:hypothetical protein
LGGCSEWRLKRMTEVRAAVEDDSRRAQVREERRRRSSEWHGGRRWRRGLVRRGAGQERVV